MGLQEVQYKEAEIPQNLLDFIQEGDNFIIAGHREPDGDCIGSQLALASLLGRLGKRALPCSAGPWNRGEILSYREHFADISQGLPSLSPGEKPWRLILVDCSDMERTGEIEPLLQNMPLALIDHHPGKGPEGALCCIDSKAPSVTFLILNLIKALGEKPTRQEAELLFFGLCTDTGFFRHLDISAEASFLAAAELAHYGANPKAAYYKMYGGKSLGSRRLLARVLDRVEVHFNGALLLTTEEYGDMEKTGAPDRDQDMLYSLMLSVEGVEAVVVLRQERENVCAAGFRSRDRVDVSRIAGGFGGGGHKNAASARLECSAGVLKPQVIAAFSRVFEP